MKNGYNRSAIDKLCSIEIAEQYLISRTQAELASCDDKQRLWVFGQPLTGPVAAIVMTIAIAAIPQMEFIREFFLSRA
jgi:hypothetical protein